ncbi:ribonuclease P protein subunit [Candidatus Woesearchaeota archaeon]|nr:ribonuclease P protein subunit [Candidatus Woesearchaeota archaeon]
MKNKLLREELIGKNVEVNKTKGSIIDETKNMVTIRREDGEIKRFIKNSSTFGILSKGAMHYVDGKRLIGRPEERIKKRFR